MTEKFIFWGHLAQFLSYLSFVSDPRGEKLQQDVKIIEQQYQGRWDCHRMSAALREAGRQQPNFKKVLWTKLFTRVKVSYLFATHSYYYNAIFSMVWTLFMHGN